MPPAKLYPLIVLWDRCSGTYSGGDWVAVANADEAYGLFSNRVTWLIEGNGAFGGDIEAAEFWSQPPEWVASGETPEVAIANLASKLALSCNDDRTHDEAEP
jgi:hypothetical protein